MTAQMHYRFRGRKPTREHVELAREYYRMTGRAPKGVRMRIIRFGAEGRDKWAQNVAGRGCPGIVDRYHEPGVLLCDYDTVRPPKYMDRLRMIARVTGARVRWVEISRTRKGWHVAARWNRRWTPLETLALQAIMGSDWRRESMGFARLLHASAPGKHWNLLFAEKLRREC
jgi:hypothetical protein